MARSPDAILLRSPDNPDPYVDAFERAGLRAVCEPVLSFAFPNQSVLRQRLEEVDRYGGLIATSPRVGEALDRLVSGQPNLISPWQNRPAYAVGPKTAARLRDVGLLPRGADAGNAATLADQIVREPPDDPLLFLCGNRRRDTLPGRLHAADISFEEVTVYETHARDALELPASERFEGWLVFFSPSGLEAVQKAGAVDCETVLDSRIAAIGPTTGSALEEAGLPVEAVAAEPSPDGLVSAITSAEDSC